MFSCQLSHQMIRRDKDKPQVSETMISCNKEVCEVSLLHEDLRTTLLLCTRSAHLEIPYSY